MPGVSFNFEYETEGFDGEQHAIVAEVAKVEFRRCAERILVALEQRGLRDVRIDDWAEDGDDSE